MRTMGGTVAEVCPADQTIAGGWRWSAAVAAVAVLRCCTATDSTSSVLPPSSTTQPPGAGDGDEESATYCHREVRSEGPQRGVFKESSVERNSDQGGCQSDRPQEQYLQPRAPGAQPRSHWIIMHPTYRRPLSPSLLLSSCGGDRPPRTSRRVASLEDAVCGWRLTCEAPDLGRSVVGAAVPRESPLRPAVTGMQRARSRPVRARMGSARVLTSGPPPPVAEEVKGRVSDLRPCKRPTLRPAALLSVVVSVGRRWAPFDGPATAQELMAGCLRLPAWIRMQGVR